MPDALIIEELYLLPARWLVAEMLQHLPAAANAVGLAAVDPSGATLSVIAGACWITAAIGAWLSFLVSRHVARSVGSLVRRTIYRATQRTAQLRTALVCRFRRRSPGPAGPATEHGISFSSFDIAVLHAAAKLPPAVSTSAPELAGSFGLQPARVQQSLEKLARNKLLDYGFGSTDGFETYVLSVAGAAYFNCRN
jgi:hypothetical protein